jgi:outer membrane protein OmpA-like peptidoglycan-associated protein
VFKENLLINTLELDSEAKFNLEINCNTKYRFEAFKQHYSQDTFSINTNSLPNEKISNIFLIEENIEFITKGEKKYIETKSIDFDIDESKITLETAIKLEKVIYILKKYPTIEIEIKSHTDSRTPDTYSLELTNKRAQSIIKHLISNGIDSERISGRGYGESELLNKCSNGVKCTQAEHEINRRTEFVIIKE